MSEPNIIVGGMSFHSMLKSALTRSILADKKVIVTDPEDEYRHLCQQLGGEHITLAPTTKSEINIFKEHDKKKV